ncbi:DUF6461 domain-containing protein [Motilibacter rhizosphaerae]|nr:DUF6461 domain-containing protein [Motilibacter rhizosphaerae]
MSRPRTAALGVALALLAPAAACWSRPAHAARGPIVARLDAPTSRAAQPADYARLDLGQYDEAGCFLYVLRSTPGHALRADGGFPEGSPVAHPPEGSRFAALGQAPSGSVLLAEVNAYDCVDPGLLARVSAGRAAVAVFWNVNADQEFDYAVDGRVAVRLDSDLDVPTAADARALRPFTSGFRFQRDGTIGGRSGALALAERTSGVRLTAAGVDALVPRNLLLPLWSTPPPPAPDTVLRFAWYGDQERAERLAATLRAASPEQQRATAAYAARQAVQAGGLSRQPAVRAYLPDVGAAVPPPFPPALVLETRILWGAAQAASWTFYPEPPESRAARLHGAAISALWSASGRDPATAAFSTVDAARQLGTATGVDLVSRIEAFTSGSGS